MKNIGITERGDAGLDFSWESKLCDVNIIISKQLNNDLIDALLRHKESIIFHLTCTGYGGTIVEPNVPTFEQTLSQYCKLLDFGFPEKQVVFRIDPIIPTEKGLNRARNMIECFYLLIKRVRYSFLDMYPHVQHRFDQAKLVNPYLGNIDNTVSKHQKEAFRAIMQDFPALEFESCAEGPENALGCISAKDILLLNKNPSEFALIGSANQRAACHCPQGKTELLNTRSQCPSGCLYCYWKN